MQSLSATTQNRRRVVLALVFKDVVLTCGWLALKLQIPRSSLLDQPQFMEGNIWKRSRFTFTISKIGWCNLCTNQFLNWERCIYTLKVHRYTHTCERCLKRSSWTQMVLWGLRSRSALAHGWMNEWFRILFFEGSPCFGLQRCSAYMWGDLPRTSSSSIFLTRSATVHGRQYLETQ